MEMHELEQAWNSIDSRLGQQEALLRRIDTYRAMDNVRSRLRLVSAGQIMQLVIGLGIVLWAGGFWWDRVSQTHLMLYGMGIHLYGIALLVTAGLQLYRLSVIDYRQPVTIVQAQLMALRRVRGQTERALLVIGFVAWVPFLFLVLQRFGMDVWLTRPSVVWWNLGAGVVLALLMLLLVWRFPARFAKDAAGKGLRESEAELAELLDPPSVQD